MMPATTRELVSTVVTGVALVALGALPVVGQRHRLRPWMLWLPLTVVLAVLALGVPLLASVRDRQGGGSWDGLLQLLLLVALVPVGLIAAGALGAALVARARHGFADPDALAAAPGEPWYARLFRPRTREEELQRLKITLFFAAVMALLWLLGVRPGAP